MDSRARSSLLFAALVFAAGAAVFQQIYFYSFHRSLSLEVRTHAEDEFDVFYDVGGGWNMYDLEKQPVVSTPGFLNLTFPLPSHSPVRQIRVDLGRTPGLIEIRRVRIRNFGQVIDLPAETLAAHLILYSDLENLGVESGALRLRATGRDPFFFLTMGLPEKTWMSGAVFQWLWPALIAVLAFFAFRHTHFLPSRLTQARAADLAMAALFCLMIGLPVISGIMAFPTDLPSTENRILAEAPAFSFGRIFKYPTLFEAYFNDHFGLRNRMVQWHNQLRLILFGQSSQPGLVAGRHGWFYLNEEDVFQPDEIRPLTAEEQRAFIGRLERIQHWFAQRRIPFVLLWCPAKRRIYPEYYPPERLALPPMERWEQLERCLAAVRPAPGCRIVVARQAVLRAKARMPTFFKLDQHWNDWGGLVGYNGLLAALHEVIPAVEPFGPDAVKVEPVYRQGLPQQDLVGLMNLKNLWRDYGAVRTVLRPPAEDRKLKGAVILHDSMLYAFQDLLPCQFQDPVLKHHDFMPIEYHFPWIEQQRPRAVIFEVSEKYAFGLLKPAP